ncbi:MAG: hypothetical protein ACI4I4_04115 [Acutalibacteraceae bacterium]
MTYRLCKRLIEAGRTDNMQNKIDVFFAVGRITQEEYIALTELLTADGQNETDGIL